MGDRTDYPPIVHPQIRVRKQPFPQPKLPNKIRNEHTLGRWGGGGKLLVFFISMNFVSLIAGASSEMEWILCIFQLVLDVYNNAAECHNGWFTRVGMVIKAYCTIGGVWYRETPIIGYCTGPQVKSSELPTTFQPPVSSLEKSWWTQSAESAGARFKPKGAHLMSSGLSKANLGKFIRVFLPGWWLFWGLFALYGLFLMTLIADRRVFCLIKKQNL